MNTWSHIENIVIVIIIFLGVYLIKTYWFFTLLIFINYPRHKEHNEEETNWSSLK